MTSRRIIDANSELSVHHGCLVWGSRVVIPARGREFLLSELHEGHPGVKRMKALARSYFWWPGLDSEIEAKVKDCIFYLQHANTPPQATVHPSEWPGQPWYRIHVDYAGPFEGKMILMMVKCLYFTL